MGSTGGQERVIIRMLDVLIGVGMWPVVLSPMKGEGDRPRFLSPVGQRVDVPCEGSCIFSTLSVALLKGCRTDPVALRTWMVSEISNDITIAFGCRITFPLQSRCATISILTPWLVVTIYFVRENPIPDDGVSAEFVGNLVSYHQGDEVQRRHSGPRL